MLGTVGLSVFLASCVDFIAPNIVFSWREKAKAHSEKKKLRRRSYCTTRRMKS